MLVLMADEEGVQGVAVVSSGGHGFSLEGKIALFIGGSSGSSGPIAQSCRLGATVVVMARVKDSLEA